MTRTWAVLLDRAFLHVVLFAYIALALSACGGGGPAGPSADTSPFLVGTWSGPMTIQRRDQPTQTLMTTWRFTEMPLTGGTGYSATVTYAGGWLPALQDPITATAIPTTPAYQFSVSGAFPVCHRGTFGAHGTAQTTTITATVGGVNCLAVFPDSGVFEGHLTLTKQGR